ncbi:MAG: hypothetical protein J2P20_21860, partial [Pseudonocardia sp.]|nr:hypothetical protein [Pseudonocardia sp.]
EFRRCTPAGELTVEDPLREASGHLYRERAELDNIRRCLFARHVSSLYDKLTCYCCYHFG